LRAVDPEHNPNKFAQAQERDCIQVSIGHDLGGNARLRGSSTTSVRTSTLVSTATFILYKPSPALCVHHVDFFNGAVHQRHDGQMAARGLYREIQRGRYIDHHVKEEQEEMFLKANKTGSILRPWGRKW